MPIETSNLPVSGGLIIAGLLYAGLAAFVTGPVIGERTIQKSGWDKQCIIALRKENVLRNPKPDFVPQLSCNSFFGWFGQEGQDFCNRYGDAAIPFLGQINEHQRKLSEHRQKRLSLAATNAMSRCNCAGSLLLEKKRSSFAIYAGSIRLVTPMVVKNLHSELRTTLHSPLCKQRDQ